LHDCVGVLAIEVAQSTLLEIDLAVLGGPVRKVAGDGQPQRQRDVLLLAVDFGLVAECQSRLWDFVLNRHLPLLVGLDRANAKMVNLEWRDTGRMGRARRARHRLARPAASGRSSELGTTELGDGSECGTAPGGACRNRPDERSRRGGHPTASISQDRFL